MQSARVPWGPASPQAQVELPLGQAPAQRAHICAYTRTQNDTFAGCFPMRGATMSKIYPRNAP
eukprot:241687-Pelagomonas_calceolata.AAC.3